MLGTSFATLINQKIFLPSQRTHYIAVDKNHLINILRPMLSKINLDPSWYLRCYPDISAAIQAGSVASAEEHYVSFGYYEHRMPYEIRVDETWYLAQYPDVAEAVSKNVIASARDHFYAVGYKEGRLPSANFVLATVN